MTFQIATVPNQSLKTDLLVLFIDSVYIKKRNRDISIFPKPVQASIKKYLNHRDYKGNLRETAIIYPEDKTDIKRILLVGCGDKEKLNPENLRNIGYEIAGFQDHLSSKRVNIYLGPVISCNETAVQSLTEGICYRNYKFENYKSKKDRKDWNGKYIYSCEKKEYSPKLHAVLNETLTIMDGVKIARDLANHPANRLTPELLKNFVEKQFKADKSIRIDTLDKKALKAKKMNALLAVAQGSSEPPHLISMHYKPQRKRLRKLVLLGKGVTFDSGGISIKPSSKMDEMRFDMSGAATVIGIMHIVSILQPNLEIIGLVPAVENMPGGKAIKPGDIVTAYDGTTVEILNTDAEGRLILADAMAMAVKEIKPDAIIDFATLTGSILSALGTRFAGLFSNSDTLTKTLQSTGVECGDLVWPMPVDEWFKKELEGGNADIKNIGGRYGGAISAAKFLEHFIKDQPWAHIDMAGTAYNVDGTDYLPSGATGFGVRLIARALKNLEKHI